MQTILLTTVLLVSAGAFAQTVLPNRANVSLKLEIERAIDQGLKFLKAEQNKGGWWSSPEHPALTALPLTAFHGHPTQDYRSKPAGWMRKGYDFIRSTQKPDGGFYVQGYANYNTAVSMMGLLTADNPEFNDTLRTARGYLIGLQNDLGVKGTNDTVFDGGVGYGRRYPHSDLNNTLLALEALYHSRHLVKTDAPKLASRQELDWKSAISFLQNCQNLPAHNPATEGIDSTNKGGFFYYPGFSQAGSITNSQTGRVSLRSYGSASYAGLLSYVYADLKPEDPRVKNVLTWLGENFTLEENPGMGQQGLYYYLQLITKALSTARADQLETPDGEINWRRAVALRLIALQKNDGSWVNANNRWWENDPVLATSYCVIALEMIYRGL
ncbi:MAG: cycloartenol synthase [Verrucomicrobiales bacterium]|nr:cycloartenol synthase [Verrucomicrobiales bacterium]